MMSAKKEQRKEQHRLEILEAAERIFACQGFYTTTMEEVAEACGWSKGTLYLYFNSKEDLFFSVITEKVDQFRESLTTALAATQNIEESITALVKAQFQFFFDNKDFFQLAISEQGKVLHGSESGMRESLVKKQRQHVSMASQALKKHLPADTSIQPETLAKSIMGAINIHTLTWLLEPESIDAEQLIGEVTQLFLHGVYHND